MKLILAGMWPPLKPLPVFRYETDEYHATIYFDKTRGEWVCHKTSLPANKVQELRGRLTEITMALPHGRAEVFIEGVASEQQGQELDRDANRRLQAILEWRENYQNGARYSELQAYLSESQQDEIDESIRLTLTARQLQFSARNVACVFDALSKAGGRVATLIEIAQRNKAKQEADAKTQPEAAALEAERQLVEIKPHQSLLPMPAGSHAQAGDSVVSSAEETSTGDFPQSLEASFSPERAKNVAPEPIKSFIPELSEGLTPEPVESLIPAILENFPTEPIRSVFPEQEPLSSPELFTHAASQASEIVRHETLDASPLPHVEDLPKRLHHRTPVASFRPQVRTGQVAPSQDHIKDSSSHFFVLKISEFRVAGFALMFLFAVIGFTVGLIMGRGRPGKPLRDTQKSILSMDTKSPALPDRPVETTSRTSTPLGVNSNNSSGANKIGADAHCEEKTKESTRDSESLASLPSIDSHSSLTMESKPSANLETNPKGNQSKGLIAQNTTPPVSSNPAHSLKAVNPTRASPRNPAPRRVAPATGAAPHPSRPSAILVTAPVHGSKPFRVSFPEKPIAATSSFAMSSQLSVLIPPEPGPAVAHKAVRLEAGELVSFVWPRYPRSGDRYGTAEIINVRTTIGQLGQVLDIKFVSGSSSLLPVTISAIRQWRYKPTLLNKRPIQAQQDVMIEFRPLQHFAHVTTQHPSHN